MNAHKKVYANTNEELKEMISDRLEHVKKRKAWIGDSLGSLSVYGRAFGAGQMHRLIAERYFLSTLLETLNT